MHNLCANTPNKHSSKKHQRDIIAVWHVEYQIHANHAALMDCPRSQLIVFQFMARRNASYHLKRSNYEKLSEIQNNRIKIDIVRNASNGNTISPIACNWNDVIRDTATSGCTNTSIIDTDWTTFEHICRAIDCGIPNIWRKKCMMRKGNEKGSYELFVSLEKKCVQIVMMIFWQFDIHRIIVVCLLQRNGKTIQLSDIALHRGTHYLTSKWNGFTEIPSQCVNYIWLTIRSWLERSERIYACTTACKWFTSIFKLNKIAVVVIVLPTACIWWHFGAECSAGVGSDTATKTMQLMQLWYDLLTIVYDVNWKRFCCAAQSSCYASDGSASFDRFASADKMNSLIRTPSTFNMHVSIHHLFSSQNNPNSPMLANFIYYILFH